MPLATCRSRCQGDRGLGGLRHREATLGGYLRNDFLTLSYSTTPLFSLACHFAGGVCDLGACTFVQAAEVFPVGWLPGAPARVALRRSG